MSLYKGWIGVDFDGTIAVYHGWQGATTMPPAVPDMVARVKNLRDAGTEVRIFTARVYPLNRCIFPEDKRELHGTHLDNAREDDAWASVHTIREFCYRHLGCVLPITNVKDFAMINLYDDRCQQVESNTGRIVGQGEKDDML